MCGIAGFYGFRNDKLINNISLKLKHRGPDGEGLYINDFVTLLNRRLAIIDIEGGNQPIYNEDRSVVVVYNGEIYNYQNLRKELEEKGHVFNTKSDTEVIVHGYEQWGEKYFDRLNGMFAIGLWDEKKKKLVLARDHFGIKPLYYAHTESVKYGLIFSSEIKPIFESGLVEKKPNDRIIYRYLNFRVHDDQKETFFENIFKLLPGEMMIIDQSKVESEKSKTQVKIQKYSNLKEILLNTKVKDDFGERAILDFKKKLIEAIKLRLISEVPVGSCLSGGLDSSTVVSIVNKLLSEKTKEASSVGKKQKVFSAIFPDGTNNEEKYIDEVLKSIKLESHKVEPKPEQFFKEIEKFIKIQEEPTISTGPYAQFKVMEEAAKYVTVLLDGQGADEMMAGYLPYYKVYFRQLLKEKKYFKLLTELFSSPDILVKYLTKIFRKDFQTKSLFNTDFLEKYKNEEFKIINDNLKKRLIEDIFSNSLQSLLRYEDRNSMNYSIEGRVPFLDFNLLKFLFSLPEEAIIKFGWNKNILRQSTKNLIPELINKRRNKIGFTTPEYQWFMRMKNKIYQIFLSESFVKRPYFNQKQILKAFQLFIEGKLDDTMVFWRLLNLELWLQLFFDTKPAKNLSISKQKKFGEPNEGKKIELIIEGKKYNRYPIKTDLFCKGDDYEKKIINKLLQCFKTLKWQNIKKNNKFFLVISEKIVAIAQGRSYFLWEIKPGFFAKVLSNFVTKTPYGIGLGSPWTMQLAIQEVGFFRIAVATVLSALTKPFGYKGIFYQVAGPTVAAIDGPTEYSLYPSNVSAKLGPKQPQLVVERIHESIATLLNCYTDRNNNETMKQCNNFQGVVIIDANDIGQNVLGNSTNIPNETIEIIFKDNPMGQADEQTPIVIVESL